MKKIYFVSRNKEKFLEMKGLLESERMELAWYNGEIHELQTENIEKLARHKALSAFKLLKRPVLVEHTALKIEAFYGLPGLHTSYFDSKFKYESIIKFCRHEGNFNAEAVSVICYCDGCKFMFGEGKEVGKIKREFDGEERGFGWDKIFIPEEDNPEQKTYTELENKKYDRSMRTKAWYDLNNNRGFQEKMKENSDTAFESTKEFKELAALIKKRKVLLFLGSGISASVGLPSWNTLVGELGENEGYEKELFEIYGDNMMLAEYAERGGEHEVYEWLKGRLGITPGMKSKLLASKIYEALLKLDFPVIYTTNYDHLLEEYFDENGKAYSKVTSIKDMEKINSSQTRIMKFHGDIDDEKSIVLSESQYFARMDFRSFMDVQFQADMMQYHILFLGYSLSDINVKLLFYLAGKMWDRECKNTKMYIFTATPNQVQKEVFKKNGIISFSGEEANKERGTQEFLDKLLDY